MTAQDTALSQQERIDLASVLLEESIARLGGWGNR